MFSEYPCECQSLSDMHFYLWIDPSLIEFSLRQFKLLQYFGSNNGNKWKVPTVTWTEDMFVAKDMRVAYINAFSYEFKEGASFEGWPNLEVLGFKVGM